VAIGDFTPANIAVGFAISFVVLRLATTRRDERGYFARVWICASFVMYFLRELVLANVKMAYWTLSPLHKLKPAILGVPLEADLTDVEIMVLTSMVTLTPGTLTLDVSADRKTLFVHFMHVEDAEAAVREVKDGFERRLLEVTR